MKELITVIALHDPSEGEYYRAFKKFIASKNIIPEIRCIKHENKYYAIEGSHRLAICKELNITPIIIEVKEEQVEQSSVDYNLKEFSNGLLKFLISEQQEKVQVVYRFPPIS